jgi:RNA polymerase sigma-70 factor (ECF subfamily)
MHHKGKPFVFDAEAALKAATLGVVGLSSTWKCQLQESDRKEIVAEAVAKAWRRRETYNPSRASFQTWVGRIARNTLLDFLRRTRPTEETDTQSDDGRTAKAPDTLMMEDEGLETILRAIDSLPESYQQIITFLSEGKGPQEIAEILGCSPNAATIRCCRARRALRKKLSGEA